MKQQRSATRKAIYIAISVFIAVLLIFIGGEIITRIFYALTGAFEAKPPYDYRALDKTLGWKVKSNYRYTGAITDMTGKRFPLTVSTDQQGFRQFDIGKATGRKKVFFLGDSYTFSVEVSDNKTFYHLLSDSLAFDCFAYGAAGYGTLQEWMILEKYIDQIKPDIIVWQLCTNDFIDNNPELELSAYYRVGQRRPYLDSNGKIYYEKPSAKLAFIKRYSTFLYFLGVRINYAMIKYFRYGESTEYLIGRQGKSYEPYRHAIAVTDLVWKKIKMTVPDSTRLLVFAADNFQPQFDDWQQLCASNNLCFIPEVAREIAHAEARGIPVRSQDGYHWNENGHRMVARLLAPAIKNALEDHPCH